MLNVCESNCIYSYRHVCFYDFLSLFVQTTEGTGDKAQDQEGWFSWYSQRGLRKYGTIPSCAFQRYGLIVLGDTVYSYQV